MFIDIVPLLRYNIDTGKSEGKAMQYLAVTNSTPEKASKMLRVYESGKIEQYDVRSKRWKNADAGIGGIYTGDIEVEPVTRTQAESIIKGWTQA